MTEKQSQSHRSDSVGRLEVIPFPWRADAYIGWWWLHSGPYYKVVKTDFEPNPWWDYEPIVHYTYGPFFPRLRALLWAWLHPNADTFVYPKGWQA